MAIGAEHDSDIEFVQLLQLLQLDAHEFSNYLIGDAAIPSWPRKRFELLEFFYLVIGLSTNMIHVLARPVYYRS